jgi:hypothetical protein
VRHRHDRIAPLIDPRLGDVEDDASSTKRRSLLSLLGSLLAEVSLPKLVLAWSMLIVLPGVLLGLTPLVVTAWLATLSRKIADPLNGLWPFLLFALMLAIGWLAGALCFALPSRGSGRSTAWLCSRPTLCAGSCCAPWRSVCCRGTTQRPLRAYVRPARRQPASFCVRLA